MRRALVVVVAGLALLCSGCGVGAPRAHAVTAGEANRLATARRLNYEAGGRQVRIHVPSRAGAMTVVASVDFTERLGYGVLRGHRSPPAPGVTGLVQWSPRVLALRPDARPPRRQPLDPPATGWRGRELQPTAALDGALLLVLDLADGSGGDAGALRRGGARWVATERVGSVRTDVFDGPRVGAASPTRYWLDSAGRMVKVSAGTDTSPAPIVVRFERDGYLPVRPVGGLPR